MQKQLRPDPQQDADPEEDEEAGPSDRAGAMERYAGVKVKVRCCMVHTFDADLCICACLFSLTGLPTAARAMYKIVVPEIPKANLGWVESAILTLS